MGGNDVLYEYDEDKCGEDDEQLMMLLTTKR